MALRPRAPHGYPSSHLHVACAPGAYPPSRKPFPKLHLPCPRVALEDVIAFLLDEQRIDPVSVNARAVLAQTREIYRQIQVARAAADVE